MKFLSEYFNSGSIKTQNMKRLGGLLVCITAILLVIALVALMIGSIVNANAGNDPGDDDEEGTGGASVPNGYTTTTLDPVLIKEGNLLLVDANNPFTGTLPNDLKVIGTERVKNASGDPLYSVHHVLNFKLTADAMTALNAMISAFYEETQNGSLYIAAAYDSGAVSQVSAIHATATAVTLNYYTDAPNHASIYGVEAYEWLYEHAHEYGFIRASYLEGEENVFRFVGVAHSMGMDKLNKTDFSEYMELLHTRYNKPSSALSVSVDGKTQRIYYQSASANTVIVPTKWEYTVSGNNTDGYIITVDTSAQTKQN